MSMFTTSMPCKVIGSSCKMSIFGAIKCDWLLIMQSKTNAFPFAIG